MVLNAVVETHLLDHLAEAGEFWKVPFESYDRERYGAFIDLWREYLVRAALDPSRPATRIGSLLREGARWYCEMAGLSGGAAHRAVVEALCEGGVLSKTTYSWFWPQERGYPNGEDLEICAVVAASRLNDARAAKRLALGRKGEGWWPRREVFKRPPAIAAFYGSYDVLRVFKEVLPGDKRVRRQVLLGCSRRACPDSLRAVWDEQAIGQRDPAWPYRTRHELPLELFHSGNPAMVEVYRELESKSAGRPPPAPLQRDMDSDFFHQHVLRTETLALNAVPSAAAHGHLRMLEFLLELKVPFSYDCDKPATLPLPAAARNFQKAAVEWLLRHGVDVDQAGALAEAAGAGNLEIARILVENGADVRAGETPPLVRAVRVEHAGLVDLLRKNGAMTAEGRERALREARERGLESMVKLLETYS